MKLLFDFFPVLLFLIVFKFSPVEAEAMKNATAVLILASIIQVSAYWLKTRKVNKMHILTLAMVLIFGGATIYFNNPLFLIWKVSILYWLLACIFLGSQFIGKKPIIKRTMGEAITLPENIWVQLNIAWVIFFTIVGFINLYVGFSYDTGTWVNFKFFGLFGLMFVFMIIQVLFISKYIKEETDSKPDNNETN